MRDIPNELDGIVDDLLGAINALELGTFVEVHHVLIEVKPGGSEEGAGIIVQVGSDAGSFFFLEAYRGVQQ